MTEESGHQISRRRLIRRGVVVGGIAWTAPIIISSMASPAGAQASPNGTTPTTTTTTGVSGAGSGTVPAPVVEPPTVTG